MVRANRDSRIRIADSVWLTANRITRNPDGSQEDKSQIEQMMHVYHFGPTICYIV